MRRPASRKPAKALAKPAYFPPENVLTRILPPELVGQQEFEQYHFIGFDLSQANLAGRRFSECLFENCNLTGATLANTGLQNVAFEGCKLLGLQFTSCRDMLFDVHFDRCQLDYASFWGKVMPNTRFASCSLLETDFTRADLTNAVFEECQLRGAIFAQTRLFGADFRTAQNVVLDPEQNEVKQARFSVQGLAGLLGKYGLVVE
ncbi:pentapeptide repeat-containing protein [Hymenobacter endophyticus]|uniref:Pentapeptide repeat-containing protein n=1 Tax=Hymenobacter endophyticus TaxID=3076335 RepID=A0ABU3TLF0_9BACT|nr:pentapeptide repeat-containing protein [Hymenobacter endophyticus]MDU0372212.1 pentapeptide repeat-containing protein [Hymenobacter endophyticus]